VIDHTTTTAQAAGHTGGRYGKGGDLLYRWGNPICYKTGNAGNQKLFQQHDAHWIDSTCPGAGNILVFNNGLGRNYSSVDEFTPPIDSSGNYLRTPGTAFGPANLTWSYVANPPASMYSSAISGAQRFPNGNTLICDGVHGVFLEVTQSGQTVWKYVNPVINTGPLYYNDSIPQDPTHPGEYRNMVFRVHRYSPAYQGLAGRDLTPGGFIELYQTGIEEEGNDLPASFELSQNYPNPFNPATVIEYHIPQNEFVELAVFDILGKEIESLVHEKQSTGVYKIRWDASNYPGGIYFCRIHAGDYFKTMKMVLIK
jgi:hypothetical protein